MNLNTCGEIPYTAQCEHFASRDTEWSRWLDQSTANCEGSGHRMCPWFNDSVSCNYQTARIGSPTSDAPLERTARLGNISLEELATARQFDYHAALSLATHFFMAQRSGATSGTSHAPAWLTNGSLNGIGSASAWPVDGNGSAPAWLMNDSSAVNVTGRRLELLHLGANNGSAPAGLSNGSAPAGFSNGSAPAGLSNGSASAGLSNDSVPAGLSNGSFGADGQPAGLNSSGVRRLPAWLSNGSFLADGEAVGLNLAGGYFDAGDYIKSTKTISHAMTLLAWALLEFRAGASHGL